MNREKDGEREREKDTDRRWVATAVTPDGVTMHPTSVLEHLQPGGPGVHLKPASSDAGESIHTVRLRLKPGCPHPFGFSQCTPCELSNPCSCVVPEAAFACVHTGPSILCVPLLVNGDASERLPCAARMLMRGITRAI